MLDHARYCDEIETQSGQLAALLDGGDGGDGDDGDAPIPTCPAWTLADLVDHVTADLRALEAAVVSSEVRAARLRAGGSAVDDRPGVFGPSSSGTGGSAFGARPGGPAPGSSAVVTRPRVLAVAAAELVRAAAGAAAALRRAGPQLRLRVCGLDGTARSWARRTAHDLLVHRADAALTLGRPFEASPDAGACALDEILELFAGPPVPAAARRPQIILRATDTGSAWSISPDGGSFTWRRASADMCTTAGASAGVTAGATAGVTSGATAGIPSGTTAVAELAAPTTQLLLMTYRRLPPGGASTGDGAQLLEWIDSLAFT